MSFEWRIVSFLMVPEFFFFSSRFAFFPKRLLKKLLGAMVYLLPVWIASSEMDQFFMTAS